MSEKNRLNTEAVNDKEKTYQTKIHFKKTEELLKCLEKDLIADWLLKEGYFPESNALPPSFKSKELTLQEDV